ncbi:type III secretion system protein PrgN [Enterococcus casseliflavus]|uniref:type III secretion system protein PrgN n=1 Tax=Enterococcus casseliflavus TaxID=37734 RepID=UPI003DA39495
MKVNTFVYPHPVNVFIIRQLGMTVDEFCELHNFKQGTVASWVTRNRTVRTIPCDFLYCLSLSSGKTMDRVYQDLLLLEDEFLKSINPKKRKKKID